MFGAAHPRRATFFQLGVTNPEELTGRFWWNCSRFSQQFNENGIASTTHLRERVASARVNFESWNQKQLQAAFRIYLRPLLS